MPQLSPLSWASLYLLFWAGILCVSAMFWWSAKTPFSSPLSSTAIKVNWIWC
uniref:ATP synthase F0 subunit 8 n=1 Tax=Thylacodes squamigerus TaxID=766170 RepID=E2FLU5_9CAEN|nr:ATP synthase F0 subunit 8 [Thylacodes squamigerus]ADI79411.1 ATP synthase F0 subunit 8 [Thylacodes squamigerus]